MCVAHLALGAERRYAPYGDSVVVDEHAAGNVSLLSADEKIHVRAFGVLVGGGRLRWLTSDYPILDATLVCVSVCALVG